MSAETQKQQPVFPESISSLVEVQLADGTRRHLRYSFGAKKRIEDRFGKGAKPEDNNVALNILSKPAVELLPFVLFEGLVERDGIDDTQSVAEKLLTAPMGEYVTECFIQAFFAPQQATNIRKLMEVAASLTPELLAKLRDLMARPSAGETVPPVNPPGETVQ